MASSREPPRKMRDLLDEYIAANNLEDVYDPSTLIDELKANENREMNMRDSRGEYNPYREML